MKKKIAIVGIIAAIVAVITWSFANKWELTAEWKKNRSA